METPKHGNGPKQGSPLLDSARYFDQNFSPAALDGQGSVFPCKIAVSGAPNRKIFAPAARFWPVSMFGLFRFLDFGFHARSGFSYHQKASDTDSLNECKRPNIDVFDFGK